MNAEKALNGVEHVTSAALSSAVTLDELQTALSHPYAWAEVFAIALALGLAWLLVRMIRGPQRLRRSVWFGRRIYDGVLFPMLALGLALAARRVLPAWGAPVALMKVAIAVLISLLVIRLSAQVLGVVFPHSRLMRVVERTISWVAWGAAVAWVTGVLPLILQEMEDAQWKLGGTTISLLGFFEGMLSAGVVLMLALWVSSAIEVRLLQGAVGSQLSLRKVAANSVRALLVFIGLMLALKAAGIDLTALSVLGGAFGVGLGLGLQKLAANYVSGFVILAERSLRIGDNVRVAGFEGYIRDITTRYTVVRSLGGVEAVVPNELLMTSTVENLSLADKNLLVFTEVSVEYGTDIARLQPLIEVAVANVPRVLSQSPPNVQLKGFGADGLDLRINFWIGDPENGQGNVRSDVNLAILAVLEREGIDIPYPQRVLRIERKAAGREAGSTQEPPAAPA